MTVEKLIRWCDMAKYKVGDEVFVRPYEEIAAQFITGLEKLPSGCWFPREMEKFCGNVYRVIRVDTTTREETRYKLDIDSDFWVFTDEMLSFNDPQLPELHMSFDDLFD